MSDQANAATSRIILLLLVALTGASTIVSGGNRRIPAWKIFYVDATGGNDSNEGLTPATAFATIHKAIETATDHDVVMVYPGLYEGEVNFQGKAIVIQGITASKEGVPVLYNPGDFAVSFYQDEGPDSILSNFVIKSSFMAVFIAGSSPTISNVTIVNNTYGIEAYVGAKPNISNCIFWNNTGGDLYGCQAKYSRLSQTGQGHSNITVEPLFVDPRSGDYHLFSERGRYWPVYDIWVLDKVTSPCIDTGDPNVIPSDEPMPNGQRINMGAFGGTLQASMSPERLPSRAFNPNPPDGAVDVDRDAILSWDPGSNSILHDVYFGTDNPPPFVSNQAMTRFDPGSMDSNTTYFWRIDEIDGNGNRRDGSVWQFTTVSTPPPKGRACFVPETGVWINGSLVSISKVRVGRCVVSVDRTGMNKLLPYRSQPGTVTQVQEHEGVFQCYDVTLENGDRITVAENHYFLIESGKWLAVENLRTDTRLQTATGSIAVASVSSRPLPYIGKVYNLKIEGSDRYLVGKDAIVVRDY